MDIIRSTWINPCLIRLVARATLQWPMNNQILKPVDFFNFCKWYVHLCYINFSFPWTDWPLQIYNEGSLWDCKTVPGTRSFHHFTPLSKSEIGTKTLSEDKKFMLRFRFGDLALPIEDVATSVHFMYIQPFSMDSSCNRCWSRKPNVPSPPLSIWLISLTLQKCHVMGCWYSHA